MSLVYLAATSPWFFIIIGIAALVALIVLIFILKYFGLYVQAVLAKADVGLIQLVMMSLRKVNPSVIVRAKIMAVQAGLSIVSTRDCEAHYLAGGNIMRVIQALIASDRAGLNLDFKIATGIDLAGRDVLEAVQTCVNPKIIDCPNPKVSKSIAAVAKDGIQLLGKCRVTVRTNIARLVGGATEETIIARVGEGIVSTIGSSSTYKDVLENPDRISKLVLEKGLDAGTAFEILSIDIADVDVGNNIGAILQTDQAEADKRVAQARAEVRRALAVAQEQEMQAKVVENRAKVVEAEIQVPLAMADAFRSGNLGIMDYARYKNVMADTEMRNAIATDEGKNKGE
ncbi:MAG: flotillin-like protein FloA [Planctomycetota bacterium]|jgi:uncharacterized protein YqfA (UPF0365 family)